MYTGDKIVKSKRDETDHRKTKQEGYVYLKKKRAKTYCFFCLTVLSLN